MKNFIRRFGDLSVQSNDELEALVARCDRLTNGVNAEAFRNHPDLGAWVANELTGVKQALQAGMVIKPRRNINRRHT